VLTAVLLQAQDPPPSYFDYGFGRFLVSPGAGGLAVLLAAIITGSIAIWAARRVSKDAAARLALDRASAEDRLSLDRESAREARWWETLRWTYDRATDERADARLRPNIVLSLVDALGDQAQTETELTAAISVLDSLDDERDRR